MYEYKERKKGVKRYSSSVVVHTHTHTYIHTHTHTQHMRHLYFAGSKPKEQRAFWSNLELISTEVVASRVCLYKATVKSLDIFISRKMKRQFSEYFLKKTCLSVCVLLVHSRYSLLPGTYLIEMSLSYLSIYHIRSIYDDKIYYDIII